MFPISDSIKANRFPFFKVKTLVIIFFFVTIIGISSPIMLGYWFMLQLFSGVISLPGADIQGGVAFFAHIAGFLTGILFAIILKSKSKNEFAQN